MHTYLKRFTLSIAKYRHDYGKMNIIYFLSIPKDTEFENIYRFDFRFEFRMKYYMKHMISAALVFLIHIYSHIWLSGASRQYWRKIQY